MKRLTIPAFGLSLLVATGCVLPSILDGSGSIFRPFDTARVRVVHASPDAPAVDVCADGSTLFSNAPFPAATFYETVPAGTYDVRVTAAGAGCDSAAVISADLPLARGTDTTVVALNYLDSIEPLVLKDDNSKPMAGMSKVRFVHASPDAPTVDITLPDGTTLFDDVSFRESGGYIEVPADTYTLQVRDGTGTVIVLTLDGVAVKDGGVYTIFAVGLLGGDPALDALIAVDR